MMNIYWWPTKLTRRKREKMVYSSFFKICIVILEHQGSTPALIPKAGLALNSETTTHMSAIFFPSIFIQSNVEYHPRRNSSSGKKEIDHIFDETM